MHTASQPPASYAELALSIKHNTCLLCESAHGVVLEARDACAVGGGVQRKQRRAEQRGRQEHSHVLCYVRVDLALQGASKGIILSGQG